MITILYKPRKKKVISSAVLIIEKKKYYANIQHFNNDIVDTNLTFF